MGPHQGHVYLKSLATTTFSFSLSLFSFFFPLSPSPSNKPTFLHKFVTPFSLVLSVLFLFASEEQQYPGEDPHLKEQYPGEDRNPSANWSSPFLSCPLATPLYPPPNLQNSLYLLGKIKFFFLSLSCGCGVRIWDVVIGFWFLRHGCVCVVQICGVGSDLIWA